MALWEVARGWRPWRGPSLAELTAVGGARPERPTAVMINRLEIHLATQTDLGHRVPSEDPARNGGF